MKRLLQCGLGMLLLATILVPIVEFFDQWDPPGLADDTEMSVFALILALCLVLFVCRLIASLASRLTLILLAAIRQHDDPPSPSCAFFRIPLPQTSPPLRI